MTGMPGNMTKVPLGGPQKNTVKGRPLGRSHKKTETGTQGNRNPLG